MWEVIRAGATEAATASHGQRNSRSLAANAEPLPTVSRAMNLGPYNLQGLKQGRRSADPLDSGSKCAARSKASDSSTAGHPRLRSTRYESVPLPHATSMPRDRHGPAFRRISANRLKARGRAQNRMSPTGHQATLDM
jgi:hypothetical protein